MALTVGILEKEVECSSQSTAMVYDERNHYYHKPFWHETRDEAVKHAEMLRDNKIASIQNELKKLEEIKF